MPDLGIFTAWRRAAGRPVMAMLAAGALTLGPFAAPEARAGRDADDIAAAAVGIAVVAIVGAAIAGAWDDDGHRRGRPAPGHGAGQGRYGHGHDGHARRAPGGYVVYSPAPRVVLRGDDRSRHDAYGRHDGHRRGDEYGRDDRYRREDDRDRQDRYDRDRRHDRDRHAAQVWRPDGHAPAAQRPARDPWIGDSRPQRERAMGADARREMERRRLIAQAR